MLEVAQLGLASLLLLLLLTALRCGPLLLRRLGRSLGFQCRHWSPRPGAWAALAQPVGADCDDPADAASTVLSVSPLCRAYAEQLAGRGLNLLLISDRTQVLQLLADHIRTRWHVQIRIANWSEAATGSCMNDDCLENVTCFVCVHLASAGPSANGVRASRDFAIKALKCSRYKADNFAIVHALSPSHSTMSAPSPLAIATAGFLRHLCLCLTDEAKAGADHLLCLAALPGVARPNDDFCRFASLSLQLLGVEAVTTGSLAADLLAVLGVAANC